MATKLSAQIINSQSDNRRLSRTERVQQQFEINEANRQYEINRARAEAIRQDIFENNKDKLTLDYYRQRYNQLSPELKRFFASPEQLSQDPNFMLFSKQLQTFQGTQQKQQAYKNAVEAWKNEISYYWYKGKPEYRYLRELWQKYGNYKVFTREQGQARRDAIIRAQNAKIYGEGGVLAEYNTDESGNLVPVSQTVYYGGQGYNFDVSGLPSTEKPVFSLDKASNQVIISGINSGILGKGVAIKDYNNEIEAYYKEQQVLREQRAQEYLAQYESDISKPVEDKKNILSTIGDYWNIAKLNTAFGSNIPLQESDAKRLNEIRQVEGFGLFIPYEFKGEVTKAYYDKKQADLQVQNDIADFNKLNEYVEKAPDDIKFDVQQQGLDILGRHGVKTAQEFNGDYRIFTEALPEFEASASQDLIMQKWADSTNKGQTYKFTPALKMTEIDERSGVKNPYTIDTGVKAPNMKQVLVTTGQLSTRAVEAYYTGKVIGVVAGGVIKAEAWSYEALGGGLQYGGLATTGATFGTATIEKATSLSKAISGTGWGVVWKPATYGSIAKLGLYGGVTGLYGYSKMKQYQSYKQMYGDKYGARLATIDILGETTGYGIAIGEQAYKNYEVKRNNELIAEQNKLKEDLKRQYENVKKYGQYSEKTSIDYKQYGRGKVTDLTNDQLDDLAQQYSDVTGVSKKEAKTILREKSFYRITSSTEDSMIPSTKRAIKSYNTGVAQSGDDVLRTSRYGFTDTIQTESGAKELAFEFNLSGNKVTKVKIITTVKGDEVAISNVFEKVRANKASPTANLKLKETILTKMDDALVEQSDDLTRTYFKTSSKTLQVEPYGNAKFDLKEAKQLGLADDTALLKFDKLWNKANVGVSEFQNVRVDRAFVRSDGVVSYNIEGEYEFLQKGLGKRNTQLKNVISNLGDDYFEAQVINARSVTGNVPKPVPLSEMLAKPLGTQAGNDAVLKEAVKTQLSLQTVNIAPTVSKVTPTTNVILKDILKEKAIITESFGLLSGSAYRNQSATQLKNMLRVDLGSRSITKIREIVAETEAQDSAGRQRTRTTQLQSSIELDPNIINPIINPVVTIPRMPRPRTPTGAWLGGWDFETLKKQKLKRKIKGKKTTELALLPDFTARVTGIPSQEINLRDINRKVRGVSTGFEIRTGAKLKNELMREMKWQ